MKKGRNIWMSIAGILCAGVGFYLIKSLDIPGGVLKALPYLFIGIGCGMFGHGIGNLFGGWAMDKNPELARQEEINQKDERNIMLGNMAKAKGYTVMTYVFAALLLAYALMGVDMEVILTFVIAYLFVQLYSVYIRIKADKVY